MNKNYFIVMLALVCNFAMAQIQQTSYRGAFAPAPTAMWTNGWTNFDPNNAVYGAVTNAISADITANTTWTKDKVYELKGLISVRNNATLTIQAGTVIRSNTTASALVITRGAKLNAIGTAAEPIVFTSANAAGARSRGNWGGIVLLGKARYNINNGVNYIEGLSQNVNTEFGGGTSPIDTDNSGTLKYVRIEFAGFVFAPNNELNGLTMGAVGSGTTVDYVQVSYSNDDSFEWFGGSVNCSHLVAFAGLDDDFDTDSGYKGICQYGLAVKDPTGADISVSECFESDNNSSGAATAVAYGDFTSAIFTNYTCIGANKRPNGSGGTVTPDSFHDKALRIRRASQLKVFNSIFMDFKTGLNINDALTQGYAATTGLVKFTNNTIVTATAPVAFVSTSTVAPTTTTLRSWYDETAKDNRTLTSSTGLLTRAYDTTNSTNYKLITDNSDTVNIDYRPSSTDATTGASFTDTSLSGLLTLSGAPGVSPKSYCKGAVATSLTANLTATGVSLLWYTAATGGTGTATAIKPTTTAVGVKTYYVSELDADDIESARAAIVVTIADAPATALGTISGTVGGVAATQVVGAYIGTTTAFTYTVPASTEATVASYLWSVPLGANIVSGQGENTIVVNYANVATGSLVVGSIAVQAVNAAGCGGAIKTLAITAVLPAAPAALIMTDALLPLKNVTVGGVVTATAVAVTSFAKYMGQTTALKFTATPVVGASSYVWELPTGVNLLDLGTATVTTVYYNVYPFTVSSSSANTTAGNVYYKIVKSTYANGTTITTGRIIRNSRAASGSLPLITAFDNELTNLTNEGLTVNPAYPITATTSNVINVNLAGVTSANTFNYSTSAAKPVSTNLLRIGVKSRNGVGASVTSNSALVINPTTSTAKLLTLTAVAPAAPAAIKMTNNAVSTITAVTDVSKFVGTSTVFTLTATASVLASSYTWELADGVNLVSGALSGSSSNVITVNFLNVAAATTSINIGVKAVNGIASSSTINSALQSTAKLLKLKAAVPAAVGTVTGQILLVCGNSSYNYTITASPLATSYVITAPTGSVVTSANNLTNTSNVLTTSDLAFTVQYNGLVSAALAKQYILIAAKNGVGTSTNKSLTLTTTTAGCPAGAKIAATKAIATVSATEVYPNPVSSEFNIDVTAAKAGVLEIAIYSLDNNLVVSPKTVKLQEGTNTISENVSSLNSGIYIVRLVNSSTGEVITKKLVKN
jgi:hypothetical protein